MNSKVCDSIIKSSDHKPISTNELKCSKMWNWELNNNNDSNQLNMKAGDIDFQQNYGMQLSNMIKWSLNMNTDIKKKVSNQ